MARYIICSVSILLIIGATESAKNLPSYLRPCRRTDPHIDQCLIEGSETIRPYIKKGLPELGIPPFDPLFVPEIALQQGSSALNFQATLLNVTIDGLSNYKFTQFDFDIPNLQWFIKGFVQPVSLSGDYKIKGRLLIAPIEGSGTFKVDIKTCNITAYQKCEIITKKGVEYLNALVTNTSIEVGGPHVTLEGLFGGNQQLTEITNKVISDNIDELFVDLKPVIEEIIVQFLEKSLLNNLERNIPYDKLYPPQ